MLQIDESCFGKGKYQRGGLQQWVFEGVDIQTKNCFMVEVDNRTKQT